MNGFAVLANKCAEEDTNVSRQLVVHSPVRMWLGKVSWLERGSSANEVIVFETVQLIDSLHYLSIWSFEKVVILTKHRANERI